MITTCVILGVSFVLVCTNGVLRNQKRIPKEVKIDDSE